MGRGALFHADTGTWDQSFIHACSESESGCSSTTLVARHAALDSGPRR
jgi:hypothetical protein